jgi:hypothetical protein
MGVDHNQKSILPTWIVTIYSSTKNFAVINITIRVFNGSQFVVENKQITIVPSMYNIANYARFRVTSKTMKNLGASIQFATSQKIMLQECIAEMREDVGETFSDMMTI